MSLDALPPECSECVALTLREPRSILSLTASCRTLYDALRSSRLLWRTLCLELLGAPLVDLHLTAWGCSGADPRFFRRLYRAASRGDEFVYANKLRSEMIGDSDHLEAALAATGHTSTGAGGFVALVGGWRPDCSEPVLQTALVDLSRRWLRHPSLAAGSATPARRMRHAACSVARPAWLPLPAGQRPAPLVLVLGGAADGGPPPEGMPDLPRGAPIPGGIRRLLLLEVAAPDGSLVKWHEAEAAGEAPGSGMWHHQAGSFAGGTRVVVFGGDVPPDDPEFEHIAHRQHARHVYVLDLPTRSWARVGTSGSAPSWRSLHSAAVFRADAATRRDALVVLGGSDEHVQPFSSGPCDDFEPRVLSLTTFEWHGPADLDEQGAGGSSGSEPPVRWTPVPRMRFAVGVYGQRLVVYSGHGGVPLPTRELHLLLDLRSLRWSRLAPRNRPSSLANTPAAAMSCGVIAGGVQMGYFGIRPCPKLDVLLLAEPPADGDPAAEPGAAWEGAPRAAPAGASGARHAEAASGGDDDDNDEEEDEDDDDRVVRVNVQSSDGTQRELLLPLSFVVAFMRQQESQQGEGQAGGDGTSEGEASGEAAASEEEAATASSVGDAAADAFAGLMRDVD